MGTEWSEQLDSLVSGRSSPESQLAALDELQTLVADLLAGHHAVQLQAWHREQEAFDTNVASGVLTLITRTVAHVELRGEIDAVDSQRLARALSLLQGLLFLHPRSARLFHRRGHLETLLAILKVRPAAASTSAAAEEHDTLINQTLSALLAALVDRPQTIHLFEQIGGLADIADLLRSKEISKGVRYACLELLFFYLAPDGQGSDEGSSYPRSVAMARSVAHHPHRHSIAQASTAVPSTTVPEPPSTLSRPSPRLSDADAPVLPPPPSTPARKRLPADSSTTTALANEARLRAMLEDAQTDRRPSVTPRRGPDSSRTTPVVGRSQTTMRTAPSLILKSPSDPLIAKGSDAAPEGPTSVSTPTTPDRPRLNAVTPRRRSSILASSVRSPLSTTPTAPPQSLAMSSPGLRSSSKTSLTSSQGVERRGATALHLSSMSPTDDVRRRSLAFSTPSPISPRKQRESFIIPRDASISRSRPSLLTSPSKRASLSSIVRAPSLSATSHGYEVA